MRSYVIDFRSRGVGAVAADFERIAGSAEKGAAAAARMNAETEKLQRGAGGAAAAGTAGQPWRSAGAGASARYLTGPNQRLEQIRAQMDRAREEGAAQSVQEDLKILEFRAERSRILGERRLQQGDKALQQPGLLDLFGEMNGLLGNLRTGNVSAATRRISGLAETYLMEPAGGLNVGQKLAGSVLGGARGAGAAGALSDFILPGGGAGAGGAGGAAVASEASGAAAGLGAVAAAAGPAAIAMAAVFTVEKAWEAQLKAAQSEVVRFTTTMHAAVTDIMSLRDAGMLSGGSRREIAGLTAMGLNPGEVAGRAAALRERLSSDPFAMAAGNHVGVGYRMPRPFGDTDEAGDLMQAIEGLRRSEDKLRDARALGLEWALRYVSVSDRVWQSMKRDTEMREGLLSRTGISQDAADLNAQWDRLGGTMEMLKDAAAAPYLKDFGKAIGFVADTVGVGAKFISEHGKEFRAIVDLVNPVIGVFDLAAKGLAHLSEQPLIKAALQAANGGRHDDPQQEANKRLNDIYQVLRDIHGGGERSRGAISPAQRAAQARNDIKDQAQRLGAFRL